MRPLLVVLLVSAGCAPNVLTLRTRYAAALSVESASPSLTCELPPQHAYWNVQVVTEKRDGTFSAPEWREAWAPLPIRIRNRTDEVVAIDWERSAFVDASGLSRRVQVFQIGGSPGAPAAPTRLDRPPSSVVAPRSRVEALVLPEPTPPAPAMFFLPPYAEERAPLKLVVSTSGAAARVAECVVTARLQETTVERSVTPPWPGHGQACVPKLGCAEGLACTADVCVDPKAPPLPAGYTPGPAKKRLFGESCGRDDDCVQGFRCDVRLGTCVGG